LNNSENFTFQYFLDLGIMDYNEFCIDIGDRADKEYRIEKILDDMDIRWDSIVFHFREHKNSYVITGYDEI
jgi:dynein heavy chain